MIGSELFRPLHDPATWYHVAGYVYAALAPVPALTLLTQRLFLLIVREHGVENPPREQFYRRDLPLYLGVIERVLYVAAWLLGVPQFVGIWLALKVAGQWKGWSEDTMLPSSPVNSQPKKVAGRLFFMTHLIGSGLSLLVAIVGAVGVQWLLAGRWVQASWVGFITLSGLYAFWGHIEWRWHKSSPIEEDSEAPSGAVA